MGFVSLTQQILDAGWQIRIRKVRDRSGPFGRPADHAHEFVHDVVILREHVAYDGRDPDMHDALKQAWGKTK